MTQSSPYEAWALHLKAAAEPLRLLILRVLRQQSYGVLELVHILDIQQSRLSHHLKVLTQAELLTPRREGNSIFYQRMPSIVSWVQTLYATLDDWPLPREVLQRQQQVSEERRQLAEAFFTRHAGEFKERQDLIAEYPQYAQQALALLEHAGVQHHHAVEVGPGLGEFLHELARRFNHVDAVDIAQEMLTVAQQRATQENIRFFCGDLAKWFGTYSQHPDLVVYNMVLHHVPDPATELSHAGSILCSGGHLLVTDLCRHEHQWARTSCGDQWLGFADEDLMNWANEAGLILQQRSVTALRNGFQVQCLLWRKPSTGTE